MTIVLDMVVACYLLLNLLLGQSLDDVATLLEIIYMEGATPNIDKDPAQEAHPIAPHTIEFRRDDEKRSALARYLVGWRNLPISTFLHYARLLCAYSPCFR